MSDQTPDQRISRLEFGMEGIVDTLKEVRDQLDKLNASSVQIHKVTTLLDSLTEKITSETAQLQSSLRDHITRTDDYWRRIEERYHSLNLVQQSQKAELEGRIGSAKQAIGLVAFLVTLIISIGAWIVERELDQVASTSKLVFELQAQLHKLELRMAEGGRAQ